MQVQEKDGGLGDYAETPISQYTVNQRKLQIKGSVDKDRSKAAVIWNSIC